MVIEIFYFPVKLSFLSQLLHFLLLYCVNPFQNFDIKTLQSQQSNDTDIQQFSPKKSIDARSTNAKKYIKNVKKAKKQKSIDINHV